MSGHLNKIRLLVREDEQVRQLTIDAITKLCTRDTRQNGLAELAIIIDNLSSSGLQEFLTCIYTPPSDESPFVRREVTRLFGSVASMHKEALLPHLNKIVTALVKRLKDADNSVRDACAESFGLLALHTMPAVMPDQQSIALLLAPLLKTFQEMHREQEAAAGLCICKVIACCDLHVLAGLEKALGHVLQLIVSPQGAARASLVCALGAFVKPCGLALVEYLPKIIPTVSECLADQDWATRKAAVDALNAYGCGLSGALTPFRDKLFRLLDFARGDKIKSVRESAVIAHETFAGIPGLHEFLQPSQAVDNQSDEPVPTYSAAHHRHGSTAAEDEPWTHHADEQIEAPKQQRRVWNQDQRDVVVPNTEAALETLSRDDVAQMRSQLRKVTVQQTKLMDSVEELASVMKKALDGLVTRITAVESSVEQLYQRRERPAADNVVSRAPSDTSIGGWDVALAHLNAGRLDSAFDCIVRSDDDLQLLRLMNRTGPVLDKLSPSTCEFLIGRMAALVRGNRFCAQIFPWLVQCLQHKIKVLKYNDLLDALHVIAGTGHSNLAAEASRLHASFQALLTKSMN